MSEDPTENMRTQQQSVRPDKFMVGGRWIRTRAEYSDMQLYNQLKYYESLFDWKRSEKKLNKENGSRREMVSACCRLTPALPAPTDRCCCVFVLAGDGDAGSAATQEPQGGARRSEGLGV